MLWRQRSGSREIRRFGFVSAVTSSPPKMLGLSEAIFQACETRRHGRSGTLRCVAAHSKSAHGRVWIEARIGRQPTQPGAERFDVGDVPKSNTSPSGDAK
jgi:hypothetical protein